MYDTAVVLGGVKEKGNGTVIESHPITTPLACGKLAYVTSGGALALCTSSATPARGITGAPNADGLTQALIVRGTKVGVAVADALTIAIGETVYHVNASGVLTNSASSATAKNAKFSSAGKLLAYDPLTKTTLASNVTSAAYIDFPGGLN
jgi:hypothetical protein